MGDSSLNIRSNLLPRRTVPDAGLDTFGTGPDGLRGPLDYDPYLLQVWPKLALGNPGNSSASPAFLLGQAPTGNRSPLSWTFTADSACFRHNGDIISE